jgi:salicylate hydroxylase
MSTPSKSLRIAIVGGGLGGLMAALCVHSFCGSTAVKIDVYEQASEYKEIGAGVSLGRNTLRVIKQIGLYEQTYAMAGKTDSWLSARRYDTGEETVRIRADGDEPSHLPVHRAEFLALLVQTIKERAAATLHPNKKCLTIEVRVFEHS